MHTADLLSRLAAELALFAGAGFLLFAANDVAVDLIYIGRRLWRALTVYSRYPRAFADTLEGPAEPGLIAVFVPAWDESSVIASMLRASTTVPQQSAPPEIVTQKLDRLQLSMWALLRGRPGPTSLSDGGSLGGSQAGARLTYAIDGRIALSLRSYTPVGGSGGEIAGGVRLAPFASIPIALTAERRQRLNRYGGRSAFAVFVEGGVYQKPMPGRFLLDAYAQAGIVGARRRDLFVDGGFTLTRPVWRQYSAGLGVWGGYQPGIYRVDAGPRLTMRVRNNMRVHVDWRQKLAGNAQPGSGPVLTLAGDF